MYEDIHAGRVHTTHIHLVFAVNIHRRHALQLEVSGSFFLLCHERFHHETVPGSVVVFTFNTGIHEHFTDICRSLYGLGFLYGFKHRRGDLIFHTQRNRDRPCLSQIFTQWAKELNVVFRHFGAFRQLFLHVVRNMKYLLKLVAVRAVEGEELQHLRLASNRLVQRNVLLAVGKLRSSCAKCQNHTSQRQPNFFHD